MAAYEVIVAATDLTPLSETAIAAAAEMGRRFNTRQLAAVHVVKDPPATVVPHGTDFLHHELLTGALDAARRALAQVPAPPGPFRFERRVRSGPPARELARAAAELGADLIVVASHGYGAVRRMFLGSVAADLIRISETPVLVTGPERPALGELRRVIAAVDLSPISGRVLEHAIALSTASVGTVRAIYVHGMVGVAPGEELPAVYSEEQLASVAARQFEALEAWLRTTPFADERVIPEVEGGARPAHTLLEIADREEADLLVIGASGHGAWHHLFLGSTASKVLSEARCPVLVVPPLRNGNERSIEDGDR